VQVLELVDLKMLVLAILNAIHKWHKVDENVSVPGVLCWPIDILCRGCHGYDLVTSMPWPPPCGKWCMKALIKTFEIWYFHASRGYQTVEIVDLVSTVFLHDVGPLLSFCQWPLELSNVSEKTKKYFTWRFCHCSLLRPSPLDWQWLRMNAFNIMESMLARPL